MGVIARMYVELERVKVMWSGIVIQLGSAGLPFVRSFTTSSGRSIGVVLISLVCLIGVFGSSGCAASPTKSSDGELVERSDERTDDEILYAAVIDVFDEEGIEVEVADSERGLVVSQWSPVNREVRHQWVARVIRANVGLVLKLHSEYERRDRSGGAPVWAEADDDLTVQQSKRDEQRLGTAIQKRFRALGGGK